MAFWPISAMMIHNFGSLDFFQVEKKAAKTTAVLILSSPESKLGSIELLDGEYRFTIIKV